MHAQTVDSRLKFMKEKLLKDLHNAGITSPAVLQAIDQVPREAFVAAPFIKDSYENRALPIGEGQTISQPYVVALMTHAADIKPEHKVLEVGMGSGYQAAILCKIVRRLFTIERHEPLRQKAEKVLHNLGIYNFSCCTGDGSLGWANQAPFDRILVTAAAPKMPKSLAAQLKEGGIMVIPIGAQAEEQKLMRYTKQADGSLKEYCMGPVRFVPLVGAEGTKSR